MVKKYTFKQILAAAALFVGAISANAANYSIQPMSPIVESLDEVVVTFNGTDVKETGYNTTISANGENIRVRCTLDGNAYTIIPAEGPITARGRYEVIIPAGTITVDGVANEAINQFYDVEPADELNVSILPAEGNVAGLSTFAITFDGATSVAYTASSTETAAKLSAIGSDFACTFFTSNVSVNGNVMTLAIPESSIAGITEGGYQLDLPAGSYSVDGIDGMPLTFTYNVKPVKFSVEPKSPIVEVLDTISISFIDVVSVVENNSAFATIKNAAGETIRTTTKAEGNALKIIVVNPAELTNGIYNINVPANSLVLDGTVYTEAISLQKTLNLAIPEFTDSVTPAPGKVSILKDFTVTFGGENVVAALGSDLTTENIPYVTNANGERIRQAVVVEPGIKIEDNVLTFAISEIEDAGNYTLHIPGELYTINGVPGAPLDYAYTVVPAPKFAVYPMQSEITEAPLYFDVVFEGATSVEEINPAATVCYDETAKENIRIKTTVKEGGIFSVDVLGDLTAGHYYTFTIPAGTLKVNGEVFGKEISKTYFFTPEVEEIAFTAEPADNATIAAINTIEITFTDAKEVAVTVDSTPAAPKVYNEKGDGIRTMSLNDVIKAEGNKLTLTFSDPVVEAGKYVVEIPAIAYTVDGVQGTEIKLNYTVDPSQDSINSINAANKANAVIYTINGVKVNARNMGRGLYIINGVKTIVK